jgi:serine/threonine-protein kinase
VKPPNILIKDTLEPTIIDLGIAKNMSDDATAITVPGMCSPCTPAFAAPEQLMNNKADITYKTDQFSVGVIAFLCLSGQFPYGNVSEIGVEGLISNMRNEKIVNLRDYTSVSDNLVTVINKMLRVRQYQRYRNVPEILKVLDGVR